MREEVQEQNAGASSSPGPDNPIRFVLRKGERRCWMFMITRAGRACPVMANLGRNDLRDRLNSTAPSPLAQASYAVHIRHVMRSTSFEGTGSYFMERGR